MFPISVHDETGDDSWRRRGFLLTAAAIGIGSLGWLGAHFFA